MWVKLRRGLDRQNISKRGWIGRINVAIGWDSKTGWREGRSEGVSRRGVRIEKLASGWTGWTKWARGSESRRVSRKD